MAVTYLRPTFAKLNLQAIFAPVSIVAPDLEIEGDAVYPSYTADGLINNMPPFDKVLPLRMLDVPVIELRVPFAPATVNTTPLLAGDAVYPSYQAEGYIGFLDVEVADAVYPSYEADGLITFGGAELRSATPMAQSTFRGRRVNRRRKAMFVVNR